MGFFSFFCLAMAAVSVVMIVRTKSLGPRRLCFIIAWFSLAAGSIFDELKPWTYFVSGIGFGLAIYFGLTAEKRIRKKMRKDFETIKKRGNISDEQFAVFENVFFQDTNKKDEPSTSANEAEANEEETDLLAENPGPFSVGITVKDRIEFPAGENQAIVFQPGDISLELEFAADDDDESQVIELKTRVVDQEGQAWETTSFFDSDLFLRDMALEEKELVPWADISPVWRSCLENHSFLTGVITLLDSRDYYELNIGGSTYTIQEKYQGPKMDLAWCKEEQKFIVRVSQLYHVIDHDHQTVPPFVYSFDSDFLLPCEPGVHWSVSREWFDYNEDEKAPIRFRTYESRIQLAAGAQVQNI